MKSFSLASLAAISVALEVDPYQGEYYQYPVEQYFTYPQYQAPDYSQEYTQGGLPGPDFNKSCYDFDTTNMIFSEEDYEHRVAVEAELLVSLEALKEAVMVMNLELAAAEQQIMDNNMSIRINQKMIYRNMDMILTVVPISQARVGQLQGRARDAQSAIDGDLGALVLYCQQFAWAPEMVGACADVLTCQNRRLPYRTMFPVVEGGYQEQIYQEQAYQGPSEQQMMEQAYMEQQMMDQQYMDQQYMDQGMMDQQYMDQQYMDHGMMDQQYMDQQYMDQGMMDQQYMDHQYMDQQYMDQQYMDQQYMDQGMY